MTGRRYAVLDDLRAEGDQLRGWVAPIATAQWAAPTAAHGWTIAHQIGHLTWTDAAALLAAVRRRRGVAV